MPYYGKSRYGPTVLSIGTIKIDADDDITVETDTEWCTLYIDGTVDSGGGVDELSSSTFNESDYDLLRDADLDKVRIHFNSQI